jgi:hypothetical protein
VQAQYFEAPFLNAITPPTKVPSQPQVVQYVPFVIVVLRLTQMPWKLVVLVETNAEAGAPWRQVGAPPEAPWSLGMSGESDADAATSTPGGGHSTASIDRLLPYVMMHQHLLLTASCSIC